MHIVKDKHHVTNKKVTQDFALDFPLPSLGKPKSNDDNVQHRSLTCKWVSFLLQPNLQLLNDM